MINIGDLEFDDIKIGDASVDYVYVGDSLVWPSETHVEMYNAVPTYEKVIDVPFDEETGTYRLTDFYAVGSDFLFYINGRRYGLNTNPIETGETIYKYDLIAGGTKGWSFVKRLKFTNIEVNVEEMTAIFETDNVNLYDDRYVIEYETNDNQPCTGNLALNTMLHPEMTLYCYNNKYFDACFNISGTDVALTYFSSNDNAVELYILDKVRLRSGSISMNPNLEYISLGNSLQYIETNSIVNNPKLTDLSYGGTIEQWNNVEKASGWYYGPDAVLHCKDGDIPISIWS